MRIDIGENTTPITGITGITTSIAGTMGIIAGITTSIAAGTIATITTHATTGTDHPTSSHTAGHHRPAAIMNMVTVAASPLLTEISGSDKR